MSAGTTPALAPNGLATRRVPRYKLAVPLDLTVLRSGIPDRIPGRTLEIGEGGVGVVVASRLLLGESVRVEFLLPHMTTPVRATAVVRYEHQRSFGLQFLRLPEDQQQIIRYWTRCEGEVLLSGRKPLATQATAALETSGFEPAYAGEAALFRTLDHSFKRPTPRWQRILVAAAPVLLLAGAMGWWQWQRGWATLEDTSTASTMPVPQVRVPAELMQQKIRHKVMPEYPDAARQAHIQGTVLLDAIINTDGTVSQLKVISGPTPLTRAAADAVRWWKYEPYLLNGQPAVVDTTIVMDFRLSN